MSRFRLFFIYLLLASSGLMGAETLPQKPNRFFNDYTRVVSAESATRLNEKLAQFERETSNQLLVAVYRRMLSDSSLEDYCARAFESWGVGLKDKDNGAVLFVFLEDRKMRIQTGYGLEATLTDAECHRIIEEMKPSFRSGNYTVGLSLAVDAMMAATRGEYKGTGKTLAEKKARPDNTIGLLFITIVFLYIILRVISDHRRNRQRGYLYGPNGRRIYDPSWWESANWGTQGKRGTSYGGGGWSSGGGGGGGFSSWSGGGGSTGGGGASGSW